MRAGNYFVYIVASSTRVIYTGVTNDLARRQFEHRHGLIDGFTKQYRANKLVYYEATSDITAAITREKQIKGYRRSKKLALIDAMNPRWDELDLSS